MHFCTDNVDIQRSGQSHICCDKQAIVPRSKFACNGRITGIRARVGNDSNRCVGCNQGCTSKRYPIIHVWRPVSSDSMIYNKIHEVSIGQITGSRNTRLAIITLTANNTLDFQSGDVVGYYHPPCSHYYVRSRSMNGYLLYQFSGSPNLKSVNLSNADSTYDQSQPLIEFAIGM